VISASQFVNEHALSIQGLYWLKGHSHEKNLSTKHMGKPFASKMNREPVKNYFSFFLKKLDLKKIRFHYINHKY
jgi:hypothetical protein